MSQSLKLHVALGEDAAYLCQRGISLLQGRACLRQGGFQVYGGGLWCLNANGWLGGLDRRLGLLLFNCYLFQDDLLSLIVFLDNLIDLFRIILSGYVQSWAKCVKLAFD